MEALAPALGGPLAAVQAHLGALAVAALAMAALAAAFARWPAVGPLTLIAALPFRVPVEVGGTTANLLIPLYIALAAAVLTRAYQALRGGPVPPAGPRATHRLEWLGAAIVLLYALQSAYSSDFESALKQVVFFLAPFALMARLLLDARWDRNLLRAAFAILLVESLAFSLVGLWEYQTRHLLWNPKVINSNQFESYFRVNSVFWDPNIYGRYLAIAILCATAAMLWARRALPALALAGVCAVLWGGLVLSFSQSSFAALLAGLAVLAALRWNARWTAIASATALAGAILFVVAFGDTVRVDLGSRKSLDRATSGRLELVEGGLALAAERPVLGHGSGSFSRAYRGARRSGAREALSASHTEPITVAAEQGAGGLILYLALVAGALATLLRGRLTLARTAIAAAFAAIVFHSLAYAAFLTDPATWALLAIGVALSGPLTRPAP